MKSKTTSTRWVCGFARTAAHGVVIARDSRAMGHCRALARVARAASTIALFAAVGALGCAIGVAQAQAQAPDSAVAQATRPFGAPSVTSSAAPSGVASLGQVTLALGLVLALIFVAAWLMRRLRGFGKTGTGALDIIADLPVGQKERAVLIRVGTQQVLIGVAPGRVTTLHVLDEPVATTPPSSGSAGPISPSGPTSMERPTFKSLLMKSLGK
jgi:flagellar protein FliO/FliZ